MIGHRDGSVEVEEAPRPRGATRVVVPEAADPVATDPRRPVRLARFVNALLVALCLVGSLQVVALIAIEAQRLWHTEREVARLEAEIAAIEAESHDLSEVALRGADEGYREQLARRQGYVFPFETRFVGPRAAP
jgi:cell division protein FtsB